VRGDNYCQRQAVKGCGFSVWTINVNRYTVVTKKRLKMLRSLDQKVSSRLILFRQNYTDIVLSADRRVLIRELVVYVERGKSLSLPVAKGKPTARKVEGGEVMRLWKKRMLSCNGVDKGCNITLL